MIKLLASSSHHFNYHLNEIDMSDDWNRSDKTSHYGSQQGLSRHALKNHHVKLRYWRSKTKNQWWCGKWCCPSCCRLWTVASHRSRANERRTDERCGHDLGQCGVTCWTTPCSTGCPRYLGSLKWAWMRLRRRHLLLYWRHYDCWLSMLIGSMRDKVYLMLLVAVGSSPDKMLHRHRPAMTSKNLTALCALDKSRVDQADLHVSPLLPTAK